MTITVIGLGKIGLPLAVQFARKGEKVLGVDINQDTVDLVNAGLEPFPGEAGLCELLAEVVGKKSLIASISTRDCVSRSNVVVVVVPLFVDSDAKPDFRAMDSATREIALGINKPRSQWEQQGKDSQELSKKFRVTKLGKILMLFSHPSAF